MAAPAGTSRHKGRSASTARTIYLPARRSWRERQRLDERLVSGEVILAVNDDGDDVVTFMDPETEWQRDDVLAQLVARLAAGPSPLVAETLEVELERVKSVPLVVADVS
jgi:hypothetical protein